ncbi:MAG: two-component regulator propeller domain-containing protein [Saprospiraceae bacterium]|nr:two-component regulator propeller domain-containing protein [Saprospiraceae bacterium]
MFSTKKILNHLIIYILLFILFLFTSCDVQNKSDHLKRIEAKPTSISQKNSAINEDTSITIAKIDPNIRSIFQDRNGTFWFGTNGSGVFRYDGIKLTQYTNEDGLSNNQVLSIQEDESGQIWFGTGIFGVSKFDGRTFTTLTRQEKLKIKNAKEKATKIEPTDLWFWAGGGAFRYDGHALVYLPLDKKTLKHPQRDPHQLSSYGVYSILKDKKGNIWLGTQAHGVCRYDGKSFTWLNEKGLGGSAVLSIFEDRKGLLWFGNNGAGLFNYDGKSLTNFTETQGLGNSEFKISGKSDPGSLARIYSINEDNLGNLWIGTIDAGVWKYNGNVLTHYTREDGLYGIAVNTIYKDKNGELWFGTDENGIYKFNGNRFYKINDL